MRDSLCFNAGLIMALYRLYTLNKQGQIFGPADLIEADTDESAIRKAKRLRSSLDQELWQDDRIVIRLKTGTS